MTSNAWSEITEEQRVTVREARPEKKRNVNAGEVETESESSEKGRKCSAIGANSSDNEEDYFKPGDQITRRPNKKI